MAKTLTISDAHVAVTYSVQKDDAVGGQTSNGNTLTWRLATPLTNGSGADQASVFYAATRTLAGAANEDLDLAASLTDAFGDTLTFTKVKGLFVILQTTTAASSISLGGHATAAWDTWVGDATDTVTVRNGYSFALLGADADGYAVTATTGDMLTVTNNDATNTATYTILIYGA